MPAALLGMRRGSVQSARELTLPFLGMIIVPMGLLPDTPNCGLRMRWEYRESFPRHRLQREPRDARAVMHVGIANLQWRGKRRSIVRPWTIGVQRFTGIFLLGLYLPSRRKFYRKISWSLVATRFGFSLFKSLLNLLAPRQQRYARYDHYNFHSRSFGLSFDGKTSYHLVNWNPMSVVLHVQGNYAGSCYFGGRLCLWMEQNASPPMKNRPDLSEVSTWMSNYIPLKKFV